MKRTLLPLMLSATAFSGCSTQCSNDVVASVLSPSGNNKAVVFSRNCGATTGFNTQVSVVGATLAPDVGGNVLILDGAIPLTLRWLSESQLSVVGVGSTKVFKQEQSVAGVSVIYGNK